MRFIVYSPNQIPEQIEDQISHLFGQYSPVWQTSSWAKMVVRSGYAKESFFCGVIQDELLIAGAFVEIRSIGARMYGAFVIGGPNGRPNAQQRELLLSGIRSEASKRGAVFSVLEPTVGDWDGQGFHTLSPNAARTFVEPYTRILDITGDSEMILAQMKPKGRYNIRLAQKSGCTVELVPPTSENLDVFMALLEETLGRDGFSGNSREWYRLLLQERKNPAEGLYFASIHSRIVAAAILVISDKTAVYYYGASVSDAEARKYMPAYLLQWTMISSAKDAGCERYDFLGIAPPGDIHHHLEGVSDFKSKFGGYIHQWPEKRIALLNPVLYGLYQSIRTIVRVPRYCKALVSKVL